MTHSNSNSIATTVTATANADAAVMAARVKPLSLAALTACVAGLLLMAFAFVAGAQKPYPAWLLAWWVWMGIPVGLLGISLIHTLTHGRWGFAILPARHAALQTLIVIALLFIPVVPGRGDIYGWADELAEVHEVGHTETLHEAGHPSHRLRYLSSPWFEGRAAGMLALWCLLGVWLSRKRFRTGDVTPAIRIGAVGIILFVLTVSFATIDWIMSLDPNWYSTIAGANRVAAVLVQGLAFSLIASFALPPAASAANDPARDPQSVRDLSNLLLASICVHMWFVFSEFLIIWSGDQPNEVGWYLRRLDGGWQIVCWGWVILATVLPFMLILSEGVKRNARRLAAVAGIVLSGHALKAIWTVAPDLPDSGSWAAITHIGAWLFIGGLWLALFLWQFKRYVADVNKAEVPA